MIDYVVFQSTFPRGERHAPEVGKLIEEIFQSTFPRGERQVADVLVGKNVSNFNPRSLVGNDV